MAVSLAKVAPDMTEIKTTEKEMIKTPKKLIEVALPLDAINVASAREKSIRHGHPSTLHLWWARRPLAAARAAKGPADVAQAGMGASGRRMRWR